MLNKIKLLMRYIILKSFLNIFKNLKILDPVQENMVNKNWVHFLPSIQKIEIRMML